MTDQNSVFIFMGIFYISLFGLLAVIPSQTEVTYTQEIETNISGTFAPIDDYVETSYLTVFDSFLGNIYSNIIGLPVILSTLIFTPLVLFGTYWLVKTIFELIGAIL